MAHLKSERHGHNEIRRPCSNAKMPMVPTGSPWTRCRARLLRPVLRWAWREIKRKHNSFTCCSFFWGGPIPIFRQTHLESKNEKLWLFRKPNQLRFPMGVHSCRFEVPWFTWVFLFGGTPKLASVSVWGPFKACHKTKGVPSKKTPACCFQIV